MGPGFANGQCGASHTEGMARRQQNRGIVKHNTQTLHSPLTKHKFLTLCTCCGLAGFFVCTAAASLEAAFQVTLFSALNPS